MRPEARRVAQHSCGAALAARAQLVGGLAGDLAKGIQPFEPGGMAGPPCAAEQVS